MSKRVIKSPKLYFVDTGLLAYLLRYPDAETMRSGPMAGAFFENFIVAEALKHQSNHRASYELYFYRDSYRNEIDLVVECAQRFLLIEIKLTKTPRPADTDGIMRQMPLFRKARGSLLSFSETSTKLNDRVGMVPWTHLTGLLDGATKG